MVDETRGAGHGAGAGMVRWWAQRASAVSAGGPVAGLMGRMIRLLLLIWGGGGWSARQGWLGLVGGCCCCGRKACSGGSGGGEGAAGFAGWLLLGWGFLMRN